MTEQQAIEAILEAWEDGWVLLHPPVEDDPDYVPYTFENETFTPPVSGPWARVSIVPTQVSRQASMGPAGSRRFSRGGTIAVQLFVDVNGGRSALAELADEVRGIFEGTRITAGADAEPICTYAGSTTAVEPDEPWFMCTVLVPYNYVQTR